MITCRRASTWRPPHMALDHPRTRAASCPRRSPRCAPAGLLPPRWWSSSARVRSGSSRAGAGARGAAIWPRRSRWPAAREDPAVADARAVVEDVVHNHDNLELAPMTVTPAAPRRPDRGRLHARAARAARARAALRRRGADPERGAGGARRRAHPRRAEAAHQARGGRGAARRAGSTPSSTAGRAGRRSSGSSSRSSSAARRTRSPGTCRARTTCWRSGTPEQIERYLKPALRGELHDAYAVTEAEAGSDPSRHRDHRAPRPTAAG